MTAAAGAARAALALLLAGGACLAGQGGGGQAGDMGYWPGFKAAIQRNLGRPYVWGAAGLKSFDCSGFVWRVMYENGILIKRTTARKLFMSLPEAPRRGQWAFGNVVFFDNLKHCGIVNDPRTFYHAQSSRGTNLSAFDPYWRGKVCGIRAMPRKER